MSTSVPMNETEELVFNAFEKYKEFYEANFPDENKTKNFNNKLSSLGIKLKNHQINPNLLSILVDYVNAYDNKASINNLKKLSTKIQSNGWDQNKSWMSCIDKIISIQRK